MMLADLPLELIQLQSSETPVSDVMAYFKSNGRYVGEKPVPQRVQKVYGSRTNMIDENKPTTITHLYTCPNLKLYAAVECKKTGSSEEIPFYSRVLCEDQEILIEIQHFSTITTNKRTNLSARRLKEQLPVVEIKPVADCKVVQMSMGLLDPLTKENLIALKDTAHPFETIQMMFRNFAKEDSQKAHKHLGTAEEHYSHGEITASIFSKNSGMVAKVNKIKIAHRTENWDIEISRNLKQAHGSEKIQFTINGCQPA